jgi:hypothetical protein
MKELRLIWFALVGGVVAYTMATLGLMASGRLDLSSIDPVVMKVAGPFVLLYMGAGLILRRALVAAIPPDAAPEAKLAKYRSATIIGLALPESGGLVLITLGLMSGAATWVLAGGGGAVVLMFVARPSGAEVGLT